MNVQKGADSDYIPYMSLLYVDIPRRDVQKKIRVIELLLGFEFGSLFDCSGGMLEAKLVLVDTSKEIKTGRLLRREAVLR